MDKKQRDLLTWTAAVLAKQPQYDGEITAEDASYERHRTDKKAHILNFHYQILTAEGFMEQNGRHFRVTSAGLEALKPKNTTSPRPASNLLPQTLSKNESWLLLAVLHGQSETSEGITLVDAITALKLSRENQSRLMDVVQAMADRGILAIHNSLITVTPAGLTLASQSAALAHFCKIIVDNLKK
jgi:hypothetical protein